MDGRLSASPDGTITRFYTSQAWIEGRAEDQLNHVGTWAGVTKIAAFPDLHPGKFGPVGCAVLADRVYPQLIGNDIGCGMALFQLDLPLRRLKLDKAERRIRVLDEPVARPERHRLAECNLPTDMFPEALGTIGGGNHFCEVQSLARLEDGCDLDRTRTWLLVHSGSRGLGSSILSSLDTHAFDGLQGEAAEAYVTAHDQAVLWARLNRRLIAERAAEALKADLTLVTDAPHNLLSCGSGGWLHRKGAAIADGPVPLAGSRATPSYLVQPLHHRDALGSLAHGAGRRYDRSSMHGRLRARKSDIAAMERTPFCGRIICEDRDLLVEEAPQAYKSAESVVADLETTGAARRLATFTPLLTFKKTRREARR
jgi:release factor H-coupled RctB family protein